jgi:hypothetical protein
LRAWRFREKCERIHDDPYKINKDFCRLNKKKGGMKMKREEKERK